MRPVTKLLALIGLAGVLVGISGARTHAATTVRGKTCALIQRAVDRLPAAGGEVIITAGTYVCSAPIVIDRDNVFLHGEGPATILRLANAANAPVLILGQAVPIPSVMRRNINVSDLVIDGNRANQTSECFSGLCGPDHPLRNNGISVRRCEDCRVERVTVFSARSGGLVAELGSRRLAVRDYTGFDNHFDGLAAYETEDSSFSGINVHSNLAAGLSFDIQFNNNRVSDAVLANNGTVGVFMRDSRNNSFTNVHVRDSGQHGIFLAQVDTDSTKPATGNTFTAIVVTGSAGAGLRANDASCVNNLVVGSQLSENAGGCIGEAVPGLVQVVGTICR